ncbi:MAG: hypothetical protein IK101_06570 [Oscillospiraceae bacterium]|nr:hypothetical protein [Oscillospiraceae bacterium]
MKKFGLFIICAALFLALALSGCSGKTPDEKLYVLSRERDAVYLVGAKGSEKVMDVPADALLADVSGSSLWYATETALIKLGLADGSRTEFKLAADEYKTELLAFEDEAYIQQRTNVGAGKVLRADADGITRVTGKTVYERAPQVPFAVEDGAIYYFSNGAPLWREDAEGRTHLDIVRSPLYAMSVDRGRVYLCEADGCFSYDAATGTDERLELEFGSVDASELPRAVYSFEIIKTAVAHDGWLYWPAANPKAKGADDAVLFMAKRLSDGLTVEYAKMADVFGYSFDSVVTFGRRGFVVSDGYASETFRYIPYYSDNKSASNNQLGLPDASSVTVIGGNLSGAEGRRAYVTATDEIDNMLIGLKSARWKRGTVVAGEPADYLCRLEFGGATVYIIGPSEIAWDGSLWQTSDRTVIDLEPFERLFRPLPDKGTPPPDLTPAPTPSVTPVPTPTPYNPDFEYWEWDESTSSVETVRSIFRHVNERRGIKSCEAFSVEYDEELTKINREALAGSDLAKSRGVSDERIMNDLEIVRAVYDIVYDDTTPHMMGNGRYEVVFDMLRDEETGFWNVWDNSSPADVPAPDPVELPPDIEKAVLDRAKELSLSGGEFLSAGLCAFAAETSGDTTKVYSYVSLTSYSLEDGEIKPGAGVGGPCAATVVKGADGVCRATEFVLAGFDNSYLNDVEAYFPQEYRIWAYLSQKYAADAGAKCLRQAEAHFASLSPELTEDWQKAYADLVDKRISEIEAGWSTNVQCLDLKDFNGDGIPELLLYTDGGGVSSGLEIYVWEDGELRAFSEYNANGMPTAVNAIPYGFSTNPGTAREDRRYGFLRLFDDGWLLESHDAAWPAYNTYEWYTLGADADGRLACREIISWEINADETLEDGYFETGWTLNGRSVTYKELHAAVDAFLLDLERKTEYYVRWDGVDRRTPHEPGLYDPVKFASDFRGLLASWDPGAPIVAVGMRGPTLAEDFTVRGVKWGLTYDEVKAQIGSAEELENGMRLSKTGAEFFGQKADIDYVFAKVDGEARLNAVLVVFEPDFDKQAVAAAITDVLGEIDKTVLSASGEIIPVEEPLWKWHDDETVGMKYLHTAAFGEYLYPDNRPVLEIIYNGLWSETAPEPAPSGTTIPAPTPAQVSPDTAPRYAQPVDAARGNLEIMYWPRGLTTPEGATEMKAQLSFEEDAAASAGLPSGRRAVRVTMTATDTYPDRVETRTFTRYAYCAPSGDGGWYVYEVTDPT